MPVICERYCSFFRCWDHCYYDGHRYNYVERNHNLSRGGIGSIIFVCILLLAIIIGSISYCVLARRTRGPDYYEEQVYYVPADPMHPHGDVVVLI